MPCLVPVEPFSIPIPMSLKMTNDSGVDTLPTTILDLVMRTERLLSRQASDPGQRMLVGLAGVPGSGKSTVSDALLAELAKRGIQDVAVVPMVRAVRVQGSVFAKQHTRMASITLEKYCRLLKTPG